MRHRFVEKILPWLVESGSSCLRDLDLSNGIYIYGAGELGALAIEYCEACEIQVDGFLDLANIDTVISGSGRQYSVYHPENSKNRVDKSKPVVVAISTTPYGPIFQRLRKHTWKSVEPFYNLTCETRTGHPLRNGWRLGEVSDHEKDIAEFVCKSWGDEISWSHYEAFIAWHCDNTEIELGDNPINPAERYVIREVQNALLNRRNIFLDVGCHRGESITRLSNAGIQFGRYELFEPDDRSRSILQSCIRKIIPNHSEFVIHSNILGEGTNESFFQDGLGYCSQLWEHGSTLRQVNALDNFHLNPDFLKIHTEGSELNILKGACETIRHSRPVIAYSVYHRREGFFSDIAEVMALFSGYHWVFRLHGFQGTGAFVYGIPKSFF